MSVIEWQRKQSVDGEDGDGKHPEEQLGSRPTSVLRAGAAWPGRFDEGSRSFSSGLRAS